MDKFTLDYDFPNAECKNLNPDQFFTLPNGLYIKSAKEACSRCQHKVQCLDYALANKVDGIWGETDERERAEIRDVLGIRGEPYVSQDFVPQWLFSDHYRDREVENV